jgi:hypothetical protein
VEVDALAAARATATFTLVPMKVGQIDGEEPVLIGSGTCQKRCEHGNSRIVDQRVKPAEALCHLLHGTRHQAASETSQCSASVWSKSASPATALFQQFALNIEQRHAPAVCEEAFCRGKPDAARRSGDQRGFLRDERLGV